MNKHSKSTSPSHRPCSCQRRGWRRVPDVGPESPTLRTQEKGRLGQQKTRWLTSGSLPSSFHFFSPGSTALLSVFLLEGWVPMLKCTMCNNSTSSGVGGHPLPRTDVAPRSWWLFCPSPAPGFRVRLCYPRAPPPRLPPAQALKTIPFTGQATLSHKGPRVEPRNLTSILKKK